MDCSGNATPPKANAGAVIKPVAESAVRSERLALEASAPIASDSAMPAAPAPETLPVMRPPAGSVAWIDSFEMRGIQGGIPTLWDGRESADSLTQLWLRDHPARPLDFPSLASLADLFYPRIWLRRALRTPAGTVSMTVYFHADSAQLAATGSGYLLGQAQGQAYRNGFFDQTGQLWNRQGQLLATTHQIVYFKG